jgi:intracellular multiplication protein IcmN
MVSGCMFGQKRSAVPNDPVLPYKVDGASDPHRVLLRNKIENQGGKIISIGQNYMISIPSKAIFRNESPRIDWSSYGLLNDVACYLKQFRKISVTVDSYIAKCVSPERDKALTLARSRAVADYLWSQDIESRFMFTHGLGHDKPIVAYGKLGDQSPNSRVEITFRDVVA